MLTLPPFTLHRPQTVEEAVATQAATGGRYLAGGTDLLPNLKQGLDAPAHLISLAGVPDLRGVQWRGDGSVWLGANTTLHELATDPDVIARLPALAEAAGGVAGPQHRRMGTLGGNVMLDTRCVYYNQSAAWREALGGCLKADGTWCHVVGSAKACVAAQSSDTVPVLVALDAGVRARTVEGPTSCPMGALYGTDGRRDRMHTLPAGALVAGLLIPPPPPGQRMAYRKVRARGAVDFPQLSVAVRAAWGENGALTALDVVIGAMLPRPRRVTHLEGFLGAPLDAASVDAIAGHAERQARPQPQLHSAPWWRKELVRVEVARALMSLGLPTQASAVSST